ncbi:hypothetical protein JW992_04415 [candidate division KSB1 bacterium]|nr:hypothetical protein [candidate division KSB1 bacterium]
MARQGLDYPTDNPLKSLYTKIPVLLILLVSGVRPLATLTAATFSPAGYRTGFSQEFNSYVWSTGLAFNRTFASRWRVDLQEEFRSSLLRLSNEDKWKDDQNLLLQLSLFVYPRLGLLALAKSQVFTDRQSGFLNDLQTHSGQIGFRYAPRPSIQLQGFGGSKWDRRFDRLEQGSVFFVDASAKNLEWGDYSHHLDLALQSDRFPGRRNLDFNAQYRLSKEFAAGSRDSLRFLNQQRRVDNYTSAGGEIESYRDRVVGFENTLVYPLSATAEMLLQSKLLNRDVQVISILGVSERERKRNDQIVDNSLRFRWQSARLRGYGQLSYWSQTQRYDLSSEQDSSPFSRRTALLTPDNSSNRLNLSGKLHAILGRADSLAAFVSVSRFQYDTPDTNNYDDRDELRINSRLVFAHEFSPFLRGEVELGVNLYHMVYIFGERSADNNWNRIFRLKPSFCYRLLDRLVWKQSAQVLANYIDYDFEYLQKTTKSFVFRQFSVDDSLQIQLLDKSVLHLSYRLQLEDNGQLYWDRWTEQLLLTRQSHWIRCLWEYTLRDGVRLIPGFTFYQRDEWRHQNDAFGVELKEKSASFRSMGPLLRFYVRLPSRLIWVTEALRQSVDVPGKHRYYVNRVEMRLDYHF